MPNVTYFADRCFESAFWDSLFRCTTQLSGRCEVGERLGSLAWPM
jgi:hypothetical protein